jgi:hypothetical protein
MDPITPITNRAPVCFGQCCDSHTSCHRYALVDGADESVPRIYNCSRDGNRTHPLYLDRALMTTDTANLAVMSA